jgi:hypothetical protein
VTHFATPRFWRCYRKLPEEVRRLADRNFSLLKTAPSHRSLQLNHVGQLWSARVALHYRTLAVEAASPSGFKSPLPHHSTRSPAILLARSWQATCLCESSGVPSDRRESRGTKANLTAALDSVPASLRTSGFALARAPGLPSVTSYSNAVRLHSALRRRVVLRGAHR